MRILIICTTKRVIHKVVMGLKEDASYKAVENKVQSGVGRATAESLMMRLFHLHRMLRTSSVTTIDVTIETIETNYLAATANAGDIAIVYNSSAASI